MKYTHVLFDLDGTLTDPKEGITRCVQYALESFGIKEELEKLIPFIGPPLAEMFEQTYGVDGAAAVEKYRERYRDIGIFENAVYDGIPELLAALKAAGVRIALATSKPEVFALRILEKYEIARYFDVVCGSELDGRRTDKAEVVEEALRRLGNPDKARVIMVGDREHDVIGAKKCGVNCIGVSFGYAADGELEKAGAVKIAADVGKLRKMLLLDGLVHKYKWCMVLSGGLAALYIVTYIFRETYQSGGYIISFNLFDMFVLFGAPLYSALYGILSYFLTRKLLIPACILTAVSMVTLIAIVPMLIIKPSVCFVLAMTIFAPSLIFGLAAQSAHYIFKRRQE